MSATLIPPTFTAADVDQASAELARARSVADCREDWALIAECERAVSRASSAVARASNADTRAAALDRLRQARETVRGLKGPR